MFCSLLDSRPPSLTSPQIGGLLHMSYTQKLWMRLKKKAAYLPGC
jgi:hypothetical protein